MMRSVRPMRSMWPVALLVLGLLVAGGGGCGLSRSIFGGPARDENARRVAWARAIEAKEDPDLDDLARAGWVLWLQANDPAGAARAFTRVRGARDPDPAARLESLLGEAELARASMRPRDAIEGYLAVLALGPGGLPGEVASARIGQLRGLDAALDLRIAGAFEQVIASAQVPAWRRIEAEWQLQALQAARGDLEGATRRAQASQPEAWIVVGPFSRARALAATSHFSPEIAVLAREKSGAFAPLPGVLVAPGAGEARFSLVPRRVPVGPEGLHLEALSRWGDVHYALSDLRVMQPGVFRIAWESERDLRLSLDGRTLARRDALEGSPPPRGNIEVELGAGRHRLALRFLRRVGAGPIRLALFDAEGRPTEAARFDPDHLEQPFVNDLPELLEIQGLEGDGEEEAGAASLPDDPVERFWRLLAEGERDPARARRTLAELLAALPGSGLVHLHAARIVADDPDLAPALATGKRAAHLQKASALLPGLAVSWAVRGAFDAQQMRARSARDAFERARALAPDSPRLLRAWARFLFEQGHTSIAERELVLGLETWPGACELWQLAFEVHDDQDALAAKGAAAERLRRCGVKGIERFASHSDRRGAPAVALEARQRLLAFAPERPHLALDLSRTLLALDRFEEAEAVLRRASRAWPANTGLLRARARVAARRGESLQARTFREQALRADPEDLELRRALAFERGEVLLDFGALDLEVQIQNYLEAGQGLRAGADAVEVVDHAVAEVFVEDPRRPVVVERIQSVAEVLTKSGIDAQGEVSLPDGAVVIELAVRKPDGRRLYPEAALGRDTVSMPGLEPGDFVIADYLTLASTRGAALPGWAASAFYFRVFDLPLYRSSYLLRAPRSLPLEIDPHHLKVSPPVVEGAYRVVRHTVSQARALHAEAGAPSAPEILPWLRVGAGVGPEGYGTIWGDYLVGRDRPSPAMRRLARRILGEVDDSGQIGLRARVLALAREVNHRIQGDLSSTDFETTAAQAFAAGRGNRLLVLRALLRALEIESEVVFVRSFRADPQPYRFPGPRRFSHAVLKIPMPDGGPLWIDPSVRGAPLGTLRPVHADQPGLVLARPGHPAHLLRTPAFSQDLETQETDVDALLARSGHLTVIGREQYRGHAGAQVRGRLQGLDIRRRQQVIQALLSSAFGPVTVEAFAFQNDAVDVEPGAPLTIDYHFEAPQWVQREGDRLILPGAFFPLHLGRVLLRHSARELPLLLDRGSPTSVTVRLALPEGYGLVGPLPVAKVDSPLGHFEQKVSRSPEGLILQRTLTMPLARVAPTEYPALADFLGQVDALEARPLVFAPSAPGAIVQGP